MKSKCFTVLILLLLNLSLIAAPLKIAMVTDVGGVNDFSFNQSAWEGLTKAKKELGVEVSYKESRQNADYLPNFISKIKEKNDLIWGIGFMMGDAILEAAEKNPRQKFAIIDNAYAETPANLVGVVFKMEQPSFLVGYIAGKMTKTSKVGFIGGMEFPVIESFQYGFIAGVKQANQEAEVLSQYAGSFGDAAKGKSIAQLMFLQGADIIFHAAGDTGAGVIEAAKEAGKFAIGVDRDQNYLAPNNVITSAMRRVDNAIFNISKDLKDGKFPGGTTIAYGLAEGCVDIAPSSNKLVPAKILTEVAYLKEKIIIGAIVVPTTIVAVEAFKVQDFAELDKFVNPYSTGKEILKAISLGAYIYGEYYSEKNFLMIAAEKNKDVEAINVLIKNSFQVNERDSEGNTALFYAAKNNTNPAIISALIKAGANISERNNAGVTPLMIAASNNQNVEVVNILIKSGAKLIDRDELGLSPFLYAAQNNPNVAIINSLLKAGANIKDREKFGMNALALAASNNSNPEIISALFKAGILIDSTDEAGWTPLMYAAIHNYSPEIVKALLALGANPKLKNKLGQTAIQLGKQNEYFVNSDIYWELNNASY